MKFYKIILFIAFYAPPSPPRPPTPAAKTREEQYQEEDSDQAAVHLFDTGLPPRAFPLRLDELATLEQHHGPVGVSRDVLLNEVAARDVFYVLPSLFHCPKEEVGLREGM